MSRISGCKPGYYHIGKTCKKIEIPMLGSGRVPSVENRAGCRAVGGRWYDDYGVCVMEDICGGGECMGFTAPVKGAVVSWNYLDWYRAERIPENRGVCMAEVNADLVTRKKDVNQFEYAGWDPIFNMLVNEYYIFENCKELQALTKDIALSLAKAIKEGKAGDVAYLKYVTPEGRPTTHMNRDAVVSVEPEEVVEVYENVKSGKPFRLKRRIRA